MWRYLPSKYFTYIHLLQELRSMGTGTPGIFLSNDLRFGAGGNMPPMLCFSLDLATILKKEK